MRLVIFRLGKNFRKRLRKVQQELKGNKMAEMPIRKLMLNMGFPMILSMILQAVYNIVDSAFVSNMKGIGESAINALTLAFPVQMLMVAIAIGTGVGVNALLSKSIGQNNMEKGNKVAGNSIFLGTVIYVMFATFGFLGVRLYISSQTDNKVILEMAVNYLKICCMASVGMVFFAMFEKMLQATGRTIYSTIAQIAGAVTNIILDPVLIYGMFGFREYGVKGAAYATVIGQIVSCLIAMVFHFKCNKEIKKELTDIKPDISIIKEIYAIGLPAIIAQALMSVMTYALNVIFGKIDETVVTAYGLYYKIQQFILFAAFGLRDAITPIVSFNHGMKNKKRVNEGIKYGMIYTLVIMAAGMVIIEVFAGKFATVFGLSGETENLCIDAMRIVSLCFVFSGINVALQGIFQALDSGFESLIISVLRQAIIILPLAWIFARIVMNNPDRVWLIWTSFPITELITAIVGYILIKRIRKSKLADL